jgi:hypothetical protein
VDIVTALAQLQSFDHHACDAVIVSRQVRLEHVVLKGGSSSEAIYGGIAFVALMAPTLAVVTARAYVDRRRGILRRNDRPILWAGPLLCALAVLVFWTTANVVIEYVTACRSLLAIR